MTAVMWLSLQPYQNIQLIKLASNQIHKNIFYLYSAVIIENYYYHTIMASGTVYYESLGGLEGQS